MMSVANAIYRVRLDGEEAAVEPHFAATGLSNNQLLPRGNDVFVVNSFSNNLGRVVLPSGTTTLPFTVFPVRSNPFQLAISEEATGPIGWVTLFGTHQVARVDLESGEVLSYVGGDYEEPGVHPPPTDSTCDANAQAVGIARVDELTLGAGGGFNAEYLPDVVLGAPSGLGTAGGASTSVLSLGSGGEIVVSFGDYEIVDGPGADFIVYENPFLVGPYQTYAEAATVSVATDFSASTSWKSFPCALNQAQGNEETKTWPFEGCAGVRPVLLNASEQCLDTKHVEQGGGDPFDLADLGLERARYVRIVDGKISALGQTTRGFDLDAILVIHSDRFSQNGAH
jgi:hypothetical protein